MDGPTWRALMTRDGGRVFLGYSINHGNLWHVEQPRGPAPAWFPDFLEGLALLSMEEDSREHGAALALKLTGLSQSVLRAEDNDPFVVWARRVLGLAKTDSP